MSQLYDYFVCPRPLLEAWVEALREDDEEAQAHLTAQMDGTLSLRNVGTEEVYLLAECDRRGGEVEEVDAAAVGAADAADLVTALDDEEGPWVTMLRRELVAALADITIDDAVIECWVRRVAGYTGWDAEDYRGGLTAALAGDLRDLCRLARDRNLEVYSIFYG